MTREETKVKTFDILRFVADNAGLSTFEAIEKAYNMGVFEQESVLNKIRAEIANRCGVNTDYCDSCRFCTDSMEVREILQIIDKYKSESEETCR